MKNAQLISSLNSLKVGIAKLASLHDANEKKQASLKQAGFKAEEHDPEKIKQLSLEFATKIARLGVTDEEYIQPNAEHMAQGHVSTLVDAINTIDYLSGLQTKRASGSDSSLGRVVDGGVDQSAKSRAYQPPRC